ncbi:2-amino-4-hydroxy-6-hydroxymethyldihydropteridine pyrophosphokinase [Paracoccus sanguinis]|nr:2-amino-4-hydroxy-6-hydroxymethyldihydropteridine diphosphokinase [Paracoccus sanguinis]KGJ19015.1 2-amino-4-hydroxy-6-hydroxymethyldihydropteridine pyrophosphokinase [Paracoccus sanguinis]
MLRENLALLALGANLSCWAGPPEAAVRVALGRLGAEGLGLRAVSRFWRTPAHPAGSGPDYVNAAAVVAAGSMSPEAVLAALHRVEADLGRVRDGTRWGARVIDLDLLAMGGEVRPDAATQDRWRALPAAAQVQVAPDRLILPHPRLQDRGFVLAPLAEIAPGWVHPRLGQSVAAMLAALGPEGLAGMAPEGGRAQV